MIRRRRHSGPAVRLAQIEPAARLALLSGYPRPDGRQRRGIPWATVAERAAIYLAVREELLHDVRLAAVGAPRVEYDLRVVHGVESAGDFYGWRDRVGGDVAALADWRVPPASAAKARRGDERVR